MSRPWRSLEWPGLTGLRRWQRKQTMHGRERRCLAGVAGLCLLAALSTGCLTPQAELLNPSCRRVERDNHLDALAFTVTAETRALVGEQLVYEVSLYNAAGKPIRSSDGRYQNRAGAVAASKTLMVFESPATFENLQLSIPATELQIRRADWPVSAQFRLYQANGECLAQVSCGVPPAAERVAATRPPASPTPPTKAASGKDKVPANQPTTRPTKPERGQERAPTTQPTMRPSKSETGQERAPTTQPTTRPSTAAPPKERAPATQPTTRPSAAAPRKDQPPTSQPTTRPSPEATRREQVPGAQPTTRPSAAAPPKEQPPVKSPTTPPTTAAPRRDQTPTSQPTTRPSAATPGRDAAPATQPATRPKTGVPGRDWPTPPRPTTPPTRPHPVPRDRPKEPNDGDRDEGKTADEELRSEIDAVLGSTREDVKSTGLVPRDSGAAPATRPTAATAPATSPTATAPARSGPVSWPTRYVVQKGDNLRRIAQRLWGNPERWQEIYVLNRDQLDSPTLLREGMVLRLPDEGPSEEDK